jgi:hypothetical protein
MKAARVLIALAGVAVLGYGLYGYLTEQPGEVLGRLEFLAAAVVAHDFVVIPLILAAGAVTARFVPAAARMPVQAGLAVSAVVTVVALPFIIGAGRIADNPSAFPRSYTTGLFVLLAVIWCAAAGWVALRLARARARR